jgi:hypothetical protein
LHDRDTRLKSAELIFWTRQQPESRHRKSLRFEPKSSVPKLCQNPPVLEALGLRLSEKQIPQVVGFIRKWLKQRELLERAAMRPRQVRYQAALKANVYAVFLQIDPMLGGNRNVHFSAVHP